MSEKKQYTQRELDAIELARDWVGDGLNASIDSEPKTFPVDGGVWVEVLVFVSDEQVQPELAEWSEEEVPQQPANTQI